MINVQQITSTLAQLSDQALQQYAQTHKEDPYTLALAVSESSRRKSLRDAVQAQQGGPAQGSVADEAVMEMAPPAAGLMAGADQALPQLQPQGFAEGGSTDPYLLPELARDPRIAELVAGRGEAPTEEELKFFPGLWQKLMGARNELLFGDRQQLDRAGITGAAPAAGDARPVPANADYGNEGRRTANWGELQSTATPPARAATAAAPAAGLAASADQTLLPASGGGGGRSIEISSRGGVSSAGGASGSPQLDLDYAGLEGAAKKRVDAITAAKQKAAEDEAAALEKDQAARGVYGKAREARIKDEQAQLDGKGEQARKMALLQAGLSILSADPSRGAFSAIGAGALQGLSTYKGDMADLAKQRSALLDKLDQIDDLRRQEATADAKERRAIKAKIAQAEVEGAAALADIGTKIDLDVRPQAQLAVFKEMQANYRQDRDDATKLRAASIQASASRAGSRNQQLEHAAAYAKSAGIPLHQAIQEISQGKRAGFDDKDAYADYLKSFKPDPLTPGHRAMTYQQYRTQFAPPPQVLTTPGQGVPVRP